MKDISLIYIMALYLYLNIKLYKNHILFYIHFKYEMHKNVFIYE